MSMDHSTVWNRATGTRDRVVEVRRLGDLPDDIRERATHLVERMRKSSLNKAHPAWVVVYRSPNGTWVECVNDFLHLTPATARITLATHLDMESAAGNIDEAEGAENPDNYVIYDVTPLVHPQVAQDHDMFLDAVQGTLLEAA